MKKNCHPTEQKLETESALELDTNFVAFVGSPNSGKTSLFNIVTGLSHRPVNYPGATVEYAIGQSEKKFGPQLRVIDTPGLYSLSPKSSEEEVARKVIFEHPKYGRAGIVVAVVDATQLKRHLLVVRQLKEAGFSIVIALTMTDLLETEGKKIVSTKLSELLDSPVIEVNGRTGSGVAKLILAVREKAKSQRSAFRTAHEKWTRSQFESYFESAEEIANQVIQETPQFKLMSRKRLTNKIDKVTLQPVFGILIFVSLMTGIFSSIFWAAAPLMDFVDGFFGGAAESLLEQFPNSLWADLAANGVIVSMGAVLVFVPQIFILFFLVGILEDSGYLARAASLIDKPLSLIGLNGRSFVPLLSGYACAIPAMMAARTIPNKREKWITLFIIPLMSCSARLPVYGILLAFLFWDAPAWQPGIALAVIYFGSLITGAVFAGVLNILVKKDEQSFFILELPYYRRPNLRSLLKNAWSRSESYVLKAGPLIFCFALGLWALTTFPNHDAPTETERMNTSYAASMGQILEPAMEPMGGDWRVGVSLITAFAAREVFIPALAVVLNTTESDDEEQADQSLLASMRETKKADGSPLFTWGSILALVVFFMIALQCISTTGVAVKEFGSWKAPIAQLIAFNLVAYGLAVGIYQMSLLF